MNIKTKLAVGSAFCMMSVAGPAFSLYDAVVAGDYSCNTATCTMVSLNDGAGGRSATAVFEVSAGDLFVTLINTGSVAADPSQVLTGLFFNLYSGNTLVGLNALSASATGLVQQGDASTPFTSQTVDQNFPATSPCDGVLQYSGSGGNLNTGPGTCLASYDLSGEWAYDQGIQFNGFTQGLYSAGLNLAGQPISTNNLAGPEGVDGGQYGIISAAGATYNNGAYNPVTQNAVQFKLDITNQDLIAGIDFTKSGTLQLGFQYGTTAGVPGTFLPLPGTLALLGLGAFGLCWIRRRQAD